MMRDDKQCSEAVLAYLDAEFVTGRNNTTIVQLQFNYIAGRGGSVVGSVS